MNRGKLPTRAQGSGRRVRRRCALGYAETAVGALTATSMRAFQAQGINSSILVMGWSGKVASILASQAGGSTSLSVRVSSQRIDGGGPTAFSIGTGEGPVAAPQRHAANRRNAFSPDTPTIHSTDITRTESEVC